MTDQPVPDRSNTPTPPPNLDGGDAEFAIGTADAATTESAAIGRGSDGQSEPTGDTPKPSPDI